MSEVKRVACFFCHANCGLLVQVENGRVISIKGDPENPGSKGYTCERPRYAINWLCHPDQNKYPLKRVCERGEGKWKRISWNQALDDIATKLEELKEEYGPECLALSEGTYRSDTRWATHSRFLNLFGNPGNVINPGTVCWVNAYPIYTAIFGSVIFAHPDLTHSNCIVVWGGNPSEALDVGFPWRAIEERLERKPRAKLIVIDPRLTEPARRADLWLQIRPGTDAALALGWLDVIINEELYDKEFVEKWCYGFEKLAERVQEYPPEKVASVTWIPENKIIESARMYAKNKPASIQWGVTLDQIGLNSTRARQAQAILMAITGNVDVPGGHLIYELGPRKDDKLFVRPSMLQLAEKCPPEQRKKQLGADRFKLLAWPGWELINSTVSKVWGFPFHQYVTVISPAPLLWRAILTGEPYPIKALITYQSNPLVWAPNTKLVYKAMKSPNLELHVVLDYWMTPTAELADYVLPAASWLERPLCSIYEEITDWIRGGVRAIKPLGERRTDFEVFRELGIRLGQGEYWPWKTDEEWIEHCLKPLEITYDEWSKKPWTDPPKPAYKKYEAKGFTTPTGKVELYCTTFEKLGYDPLPYYEEPPESPIRTPEAAREYPLILITGCRFRPMYHSEHRQLGIGMREMNPDPIMEIHPETARRLGVRDGDWVWIETRRGRVKQKARLFTGIDPRVVSLQHGWWFPEMPGEEPFLHGAFESNENVLTPDDPDTLDPLVGGWCNRGLLCKVYPATKAK